MNYPLLCSQAPLSKDCCCCSRCNVGGCDLKVLPCNCCLHARCCPVSETQLLTECPVCKQPAKGLRLIPIAFDEIDQATLEAAQTSLTNKRGKKRQNATVARLNPALLKASAVASGEDSSESNDLRTGRWTAEETAYCDKLIYHFERGSLPIPEKIKLNDFLSNMLKSKQSRLTKKMKNAKLSVKQYKRQISFILGDEEARDFSQLETALFESIKCRMERAELRFHMQRVWRELFSGFCLAIGQKLELDAWLRSVEEMERRASQAQDDARKARRKAMIGSALSEDTKNAQSGVLIDPNVFVDRSSQVVVDQNGDLSELASETDTLIGPAHKRPRNAMNGMIPRPKAKSSSFVARVMLFVQQRQLPFEHVDIWAPCSGGDSGFSLVSSDHNRLVFAGCATADSKISPDDTRVMPLSAKDQSDLLAFGEYSQRFSFEVGSGLPGRVYSSGVASWEQGISNAPEKHFERGGGAKQWGIETALGLCVSSPNVGRVVVVLYSIHDRPRDEQLMLRLSEELKRLMPIPRWKLVVDVGADASFDMTPVTAESHESELRDLLENLLTNQASEIAPVAGFYPLLQLMKKGIRSETDKELVTFALNSYDTFKRQGRPDTEIAWMACRDFSIKEAELRKRNTEMEGQSPQSLCDQTACKDQSSCCPPKTNGMVNGGPCLQPQGAATGSCCPPQQNAPNACCPPQQKSSNACCPPQQNSSKACCPPQQNSSNACCPQPTSVSNQSILNVACGSQSTANTQCPPPQQLPSTDHELNQIPELTITTMHSALANGQNGYPSADPRTSENLVLPGQLESLIFDSNNVEGDGVSGGNMQLEGVSANYLAQLFQF